MDPDDLLYNISSSVFFLCRSQDVFSLWRRMFADDSLVCVWVQRGVGPFIADCCTSCVTQTPPKPSHRKSSMLFYQTKGTTFSCRWATSSLPFCSWSSSSSLSFSSHADTSPKVCTFLYENISLTYKYMLILDMLLPFQCFTHSLLWGEWQHTHTYISSPWTHSQVCVFAATGLGEVAAARSSLRWTLLKWPCAAWRTETWVRTGFTLDRRSYFSPLGG